MTCRVLLFARLRDLAGAGELTVEVPPGSRVGDLRRHLAAAFPALAGLLPSCAVALDDQYVGDATPLPEGAEVALLPPVSGGQDGRGSPRLPEHPWSV